MDFDQLKNLQDLLAQGMGFEDGDDEKLGPSGPISNPGDIAGNGKKEVAQPNTKIQTTVNNRDVKGGIKKATDIWAQDEVKEIIVDKSEGRKKPDYEIMFRQKVGTEDVYLGMSNLDPSSTKCQELLMKVKLPNTVFKDVTLDVTEQAVCVQSSKFYLYHILPYKVVEKDGKAKWVSDKYTLEITLPIVREFDF